MTEKVLVLAGKTLDKVMPAIRLGRLRAEPTDLRRLDPGSCACRVEDVLSINLGPLAYFCDASESDPLHVAVSAPGLRRDLRGFEFSLFPEEFPAGTLMAISPNILVPSFPAYFMLKARDLDFEELLLLGMELCGTYAHDSYTRADGRCEFLVEPALEADDLRGYLEEATGIKGVNPAKTAASWILDNSYSPQETILALEQYLKPMRGGRGYPKPRLNPEIEVPREFRRLTARDTFKPDIYWEGMLDLEYDSAYHSDPAQVERDKARASDVQALGIPVIQATGLSLSTCERAELLGRQIGKALETGMGRPMTMRLRRLYAPELQERRDRLHLKLRRLSGLDGGRRAR
ncbi:MAG: hypothetical protein Q4B45_03165 [Coriobacteriia bacterium]|nr:hypothetical protein [Coriobacteriia bacterium]